MNKLTIMKISTFTFGAMALVLMSGSCKAQVPALKEPIKMTDNEQFEKATSAFKALLVKEPENAEVYYYLGENLLASDKSDSAEVVFKKGLEINSKMPLNHIGMAKIQQVKGKPAEAQATIDAALNLFNEKGVKIKDELKVRTYTEAAEALLEGNSKNTAKALEYVNKALALDENSVGAYIVKGDALFEADPLSATEPLNAYKKAAELDRTSAKALARAAYMYYRGRIYDQSVKNYTEALKIDPNFAPAYSGRGDAYYYSNKAAEAIADYQKYLELNKGNISARKRYAGFLYVTKKYDEALAEISAVEKVVGSDDVLLNRLKGYVLYEKGDYAGALASMESYMKKQSADKINSTDFEYMGRIYGKSGNDSLMSYYYNRAITMDYKNKQALVAEAIAYYKDKKDYGKQAYWYGRKVKMGSKDANDFYYWGTNAYDAGMYDKADSALTEYVKIMPDFATAWLYKARAIDAQDSLQPKQWTAKETYATLLTKIKPEEADKNKTRIAEAYYYYARYYYLSDKKDLGMAKCYLNKIVALNVSADWVKRAQDLLSQKDLNAATAAADCP